MKYAFANKFTWTGFVIVLYCIILCHNYVSQTKKRWEYRNLNWRWAHNKAWRESFKSCSYKIFGILLQFDIITPYYDKFSVYYHGISNVVGYFRRHIHTCSLWLFHLLPVSLHITDDKLTFFIVVQCSLNLSLRVSCTKFIFWQQTDSGPSLISELLAPSS